MPFRIHDAPLVAEHRDEGAWRIKNVGQLLLEPPGVLPAAPIVVIAAAYPSESAGVEDVAPLVEDRAILPAIHRDLAVAMEFPTHNPISIRRRTAVIPQQLHRLRFGAVARFSRGSRRAGGPHGRRLPRRRQ